jgi:hypothetical protein
LRADGATMQAGTKIFIFISIWGKQDLKNAIQPPIWPDYSPC